METSILHKNNHHSPQVIINHSATPSDRTNQQTLIEECIRESQVKGIIHQ